MKTSLLATSVNPAMLFLYANVDTPISQFSQLYPTVTKLFNLEGISIVIFRPHFIWERKIFKANGIFFTKFAKHQIYV